MENTNENPPGNFCSMLPIIHGIDSYSARSKCYLAIKKPCMYKKPDFWGLAARLIFKGP